MIKFLKSIKDAIIGFGENIARYEGIGGGFANRDSQTDSGKGETAEIPQEILEREALRQSYLKPEKPRTGILNFFINLLGLDTSVNPYLDPSARIGWNEPRTPEGEALIERVREEGGKTNFDIVRAAVRVGGEGDRTINARTNSGSERHGINYTSEAISRYRSAIIEDIGLIEGEAGNDISPTERKELFNQVAALVDYLNLVKVGSPSTAGDRMIDLWAKNYLPEHEASEANPDGLTKKAMGIVIHRLKNLHSEVFPAAAVESTPDTRVVESESAKVERYRNAVLKEAKSVREDVSEGKLNNAKIAEAITDFAIRIKDSFTSGTGTIDTWARNSLPEFDLSKDEKAAIVDTIYSIRSGIYQSQQSKQR